MEAFIADIQQAGTRGAMLPRIVGDSARLETINSIRSESVD